MALQEIVSLASRGSSALGLASAPARGQGNGALATEFHRSHSLKPSWEVAFAGKDDTGDLTQQCRRGETSHIEASLGPSTSGRPPLVLPRGRKFFKEPLILAGIRTVPLDSARRGSSDHLLERGQKPRKSNHFSSRHRSSGRLAAVMSLDALQAGGVAWPAVNPGIHDEDEGEPLSCLFIGPIEEAEKVHLEALYMQARDSYYNGRPLILDEMFDKVETRLRNLRSKMVLKYPRCSLTKFAAYSDAEEDTSQMSTLMAVWGALGLAGAFAAVVPPLCAATSVCQTLVNEALEPWHAAGAPQGSPLSNFVLALGLLGGVPLASAAVTQVQSLMRGEVVALKGCCPNCGEEVYAFLEAKQQKPRHKSECHVCEHPLVFHATVETSKKDGKQWAYGRVYLVTRSRDLEPQKPDRSAR